MKNTIVLAILLLLTGSALVSAAFVPYQRSFGTMDDFFSEKYSRFVQETGTKYDANPFTVVDPSGQVLVYRPYGQSAQTRPSYYRITDTDITPAIAEGSYDDGFNQGYYVGYTDGTSFQRYGYEGYLDYMANIDSGNNGKKSGYYQLNDRTLKISVQPSSDEFNTGYVAGIASGFKDGFYSVKYKGENKAQYAFKEFKKKFPGTFVPMQTVSMPRQTYRTYPVSLPYSSGSRFYGFNYR